MVLEAEYHMLYTGANVLTKADDRLSVIILDSLKRS